MKSNSSVPPERLRNLFLEALDCEPAKRAAFLDETCGGDVSLRSRLEELLSNHREDGFLERAAAVAPTVITPHSGEAGESIGPYHLLQQLGEGGFGTVWMAEQEQPVRRRVALKIIKPGMDSREVIARFEQERQALALMDHPNISRVIDAGATDAGRPYFVMELVRGTPVTRFADEQHLNLEERIALFITVCQAVQHAHQKGVIHRDLKPSNILVAVTDGQPVPKVIDFGVAKAIHGRIGEHTVYTHFQQIIGTPLYMSPEQAGMNPQDVDTRSDIYSLGVLLYELITGRTPIDADKLSRSGLEEVRRLVREVDPLRPSTRIQKLADDELSSIARLRRIDPAKLAGEVRGELDWMVMKCLEKDRSRRYETANGLALDLQRFLRDEPVSASPPSRTYRFRKAVRRHRAAFTAAAAVLVALTAAAIVSTRLYLRERELFRLDRLYRASEEARAANESREAFKDAMLTGLTGDAARMAAAMDEARAKLTIPQFLMLQGGHGLLTGRYDEAIPVLTEANKAVPDSAAARGLLAVAHFRNGQWTAYERDMALLGPMNPNPQRPEDLLFKGLALGYYWPEEALKLIAALPPQFPGLQMISVIPGEIGVWKAMRSGRVEDALNALKELENAPENPTVLGVRISAHLIAARLDSRDRAVHRAQAAADAGKLQRFLESDPALPGAVAIRALQLQELGRNEEAMEILRKQYEAAGNGLVAQRYALELFREGHAAEAPRVIQPQRAAPDAFFHMRMLAGDPSSRARVLDEYHAFRKRYINTSAEVFAPLIPLLLGEKERAKLDAQDFRQRSEAQNLLSRLPVPFPQLVDFFCSEFMTEDGQVNQPAMDRLLASAGNSPIGLTEIHNAIGYRWLAEGNSGLARRHFQMSVDAGAFLSNAHLDSRIHLARLKAE